MLELRNITKRFDGIVANQNVSIKVEPSTIHAIVGENGAGKSTAMKIAYGFYPLDAGEILVDGTARNIQSPADAIALGIGMVHQHFMLVDTMTVAENIALGAENGGAFNLDLNATRARISDLSKNFNLAVDPDAVIETLSIGQQQRVELLKALYRDAQILILDEPTAVLTPPEVAELFLILHGMRARGKTIIIITHKLDEVLAVSDAVTVLRDGRTVGSLRTSETSQAELARLMVGREVLLKVEKGTADPREVVLSVENLRVSGGARHAVDNINFEVCGGEIVGIAGVEGNGQTELIETLAGLTQPLLIKGRILLAGADISRTSARKRRELGVAHIPEDRHRRGLLLDSDLTENAILGASHHAPFAKANGFLNNNAIKKRIETILADFDVRPARLKYKASALSGGNQQKLIVGREFESKPRLLLVAQPTRGVDIGAIEFIHRKLIELRDAGCAILLVSAELEEVLSLADRVLVMRKGKIVGEIDPQTVSQEEVGLLMTGGGN